MTDAQEKVQTQGKNKFSTEIPGTELKVARPEYFGSSRNTQVCLNCLSFRKRDDPDECPCFDSYNFTVSNGFWIFWTSQTHLGFSKPSQSLKGTTTTTFYWPPGFQF